MDRRHGAQRSRGAALMAAYRKQHIIVHRADTIRNTDYVIGAIMRTELERAEGERRKFGEWLVADITTDVVEQYRQARLSKGSTGANRHLELLRSLFNWASSSKRKLASDNPFLDGTTAAVKMSDELPRRRRLQAGEGDRLLKACNTHLWAIVQCALETGMRRGEILSLQWSQVRLQPKAEIFLPAAKTKTKADRTLPISSTLKAVLEMRRQGPDGADHAPDTYVFGNEAGEPVKDIKRAWQRALLLAHGHKPEYVRKTVGEGEQARTVHTALLTTASQKRLRVIDLHFHDLRREAGSRWLDAGVPLHRIQKWLGHTNIAQTSTYLMADSSDDDAAMQRFEEQRAKLQRSVSTTHWATGLASLLDLARPV
jgi:integrase